MKYRDKLEIAPYKNNFTNSEPDWNKGTFVIGTIEETAGMIRGGGYDASSGDAHVYLPPQDENIEGYYLRYSGRVYRIISVSVGKAALTSNRIKHIEAELQKVER